MLRVHVLNVAHGDCIVLEYQNEGHAAYALIDSNSQSAGPVKALQKLRELGAQRLSFVALTHPHRDHYMGLQAVLEAYAGRVDRFYTFPVDKDVNRLSRLKERVKAQADRSDSETVLLGVYELLYVIKFAQDLGGDWSTPQGLKSTIEAPGFQGVSFDVVLPPAKVKGDFYGSLDRDTTEISDPHQNELSLAILLTYRGKRVLLAGDGTLGNWQFVSRRWDGVQLGTPLQAVGVKMPHHGSKKDSSDKVIDFFFGPAGEQDRYAIISAEGSKHHPHSSVLRALKERGIKPYCTNLAQMCRTTVKQRLIVSDELSPVLTRYINSADDDEFRAEPQSCQGDITLEIHPDGSVHIEREIKAACPVRGDLDFLSA